MRISVLCAVCRVRVDESPEALRGRARPGSVLVGTMVQWVAGAGRDGACARAGGPRAHLACRYRLASTRPPRDRGAAKGRPPPVEATATRVGTAAAPRAATRAHPVSDSAATCPAH